MPDAPTPYTKFGFDTEFFELVPGQQGGGGPTASSLPNTPAQQKALVEEAKQQAYNEGYSAGMAEGQKAAQADLAQLQQHLQNALLALQNAQNEREEHLLMQCLSLLRVTLHQMVGQIVTSFGPELLEHHLRALLPLLKSDEALTLRIHPAARGFHEKLGLPQAAIMGLPMQVVTDPSLGPTDAVVQWTNGGVESKLAQHLAQMDVLLAGVGAQMLAVEHKTNLNPLPPAAARVAAAATALPEVRDPSMEAAEAAAKARAAALLGDDDDLVDALK